ncbi:hypothetical protein H6G76_01030 [Nostoc sp. FACHB-152]|uniref:hypothetical protein n=1 Tax=unclassified Nostoc TaxID=2593658 RepID=UPI00168A3A63|nr:MULTISPECIES: hypothetical protein [unclassified Nostoc]MBD2445753.1 hypothetical protein [Nostoc sp. FACHB-152]MBD2466867.1 hypothetical protein [Nostoc sp. FACHB-145]
MINNLTNQNKINSSIASKSPCISYYNMRKSARIMRDITLCYFPIYNLNTVDFFQYYAILGFIEALIYQADFEVETEQHQQIPLQKSSCWSAKQSIILQLVKELNLEHWSIKYYVNKLAELCDLETKLVTTKIFTHADISQINELRSSDYRLLHSLLIQSLGKDYDKAIFDVMWPIEIVTEIYDDIYSYNSDVVAGDFNTYDLFVKLYGQEAPKFLEAEMDRYEKMFYDIVAQLPTYSQQLFHSIWDQMQQIYPRPKIPQPIYIHRQK